MNNNFIYQARAKSEYMLWTWVNIDKSEYDTLVDNDLFDTRILTQEADSKTCPYIEIEKLQQKITVYEKYIEEIATRTNTCTYNVLERLCPDCGRKRKFASNQNM